jgi:hypothetical protein
MTPELQAITQRLEEVEHQVAHLQALAVEHSDTDRTEAARTINAQTFIVTDKHGVRRAELSMTIPAGEAEEQPWLGLFDANGNVRACLGVHGGLPWLEFYDGNQKSVVNVTVDEHGPQIGLFYGNGKAAAAIALPEAGPRVSLFGEEGKPAVVLSLPEEGPQMTLFGGDGRGDIHLTGFRGGPEISLAEAGGKGQLSLRVTPSGTKELFMGEYGHEAQPTVGPSLKLGVTNDGPRLQFGKDNTVFWSVP